MIIRNGEPVHILVGSEHDFNNLTFLKEDITCLLDACIAGDIK
jgi:hypothetical protein